MAKIKVGIVGGAGYTGGELLRILLQHPDAEVLFVHSNSQAGKPVHAMHKDLFGETDIVFAAQLDSRADVVFLCMGHGESRKFLEKNIISAHTRIIDLSQDFRLDGTFQSREFVYGLPENNRETIKNAFNIANPGCFATAIQLSILPLAAHKALKQDIHISGITGSTGAGQSLSETSHFSWRNNNISTYKVFEHQHLNEVMQNLGRLQADVPDIHFVPYRGNFSRGILVTSYTQVEMSQAEAVAMYMAYYVGHPFVHVSDENPDLKQVVNTNKAILHVSKKGNQLVITSAIDNLLKGASGQAVQNMNLMFGLDESAGLKLKAIAF